MANNEFDKDKSLKSVFDGFISAYAGRKTDVAFSDWLAEKLCQVSAPMIKCRKRAKKKCRKLAEEREKR